MHNTHEAQVDTAPTYSDVPVKPSDIVDSAARAHKRAIKAELQRRAKREARAIPVGTTTSTRSKGDEEAITA